METSTIVDGDAAAAVTEGVAAAVTRLEDELSRKGPRPPDEWLAFVGGCQALVNRLTAVQDAAIAEVARFEAVWCEDGTRGWQRHGPGRVALGAADLVAPRLGASHHQATWRVDQAVRLTGREPVEVDDRGGPDHTGLDGLHDAMGQGLLDGYRAGVVAHELEGCPADVARAVVTALQPHLGHEDSAALRRRTRRMLARISPDLLRQRAARARAETGLRRWVGEPGVDVWQGRFPSEDSAVAWAAVDALARRYVAEGTCGTIEQARGRALTDLVTQQADVEVSLVLTVPADALSVTSSSRSGSAADADPPPEGPATGSSQPGPLPGRATPSPQRGGRADRALAPEPAEALATPRHTGAGGVTPAPAAEERPDGSETVHRSGRDRSGDLVQVHGSRPHEPVLVAAGWLALHTGDAARAVCHPRTGARLDPGESLSTPAYRPGPALVALVRARDGRCRFPGCSVAARFCDLDHVRPWPSGPTAVPNLICLCRRHHRIKQSPGWRLRLAPDGIATWTDPTDAVRTTEPLDGLESVVLRDDEATVEGAGATSAVHGADSTRSDGAGRPVDSAGRGGRPPPARSPAPSRAGPGLERLPSRLEERHEWHLHEHEVLLEHRARGAAAPRARGRAAALRGHDRRPGAHDPRPAEPSPPPF